jgi:DDE superfamily endonuclease
MPACQAAGGGRLQQRIPPTNTRPVRVFSPDERRFGLLPIRRRRLTARGVQPVGSVQPVCAWFSVDGAVEPTTGARFFLERPYLNADTFQLFLAALAHACPDSLKLLRLDNSGAHTAQPRTLPDHGRFVCLAPYGPELHPRERVWRARKDALAWLHFPTLDAQPDSLATRLRASEAATLQTLTGYPYLVEAIHALYP